jgi:iron complex transport system substrate-binding protein
MLKMKRFVWCLVVVVLACFLVTACGKSRGSNSGNRSIVDMSGRTVEIPENVNRVFVDWVQGTLHMMTLGALDKVVAVRTGFDGEIFTWARAIYPNFDIVTRDDAPFSNLEALLAYEPDVVFTIEQGDFKSDDYERVGIPAIVVRFEDYDTFRQSITIIGNVLGGKYAVKAEKFNAFFSGNESLVKERLLNINADEKKLVHLVDGRIDDALRTVGRDQVEAAWIKTAGANFAAEEFTGRAIDITEEKFLQLNPDIILIGAQYQASAMRWLMSNATLRHLDAVKNNNRLV